MKATSTLAACLLTSCITLAQAQPQNPQAVDRSSSFSVQLEEAIYTEEILGDTKAAQKHYQTLIKEAAALEGIAAEAYARLIQMLVKTGETSTAQQQFINLSAAYPRQTKWLAFAQDALGIAPFSPSDLIPAPWIDGERLYFQRKNLGRHVLFHNIQTKKTGQLANTWQTQLMYFYTDSGHRDHWQTLVKADTNALINASHKMMHAKGREISALVDKITIKDLEQGTEFSIPRKENQYDQGLLTDLLRRLPYTQGYKTTLKLLREFSANISTMATNQSITVPAGKFHCYLVEVEIKSNNDTVTTAKAWITNDRHRYLVKYEVGDITDELQSISQLPLGTYRHEDAKGISIDLPENWSAFYKNKFQPANEPTYIQPMRVDRHTGQYQVDLRHDVDWENVTRDDAVTEINNWDYSWLKSYAFKPDSVEHTTVNGQPGVRFAADVVFKTEPLIYYRVVIAKAPKVVTFSFFSHKDRFDKDKALFDQIASSVTFRNEPSSIDETN